MPRGRGSHAHSSSGGPESRESLHCRITLLDGAHFWLELNVSWLELGRGLCCNWGLIIIILIMVNVMIKKFKAFPHSIYLIAILAYA